jgi:hypothetical protein
MDDLAAIAVLPDPEARIVPIPSRDAAGVWPLALPLLDPAIALAGGDFEPSDVLAAIEARDFQLWLAQSDDDVIGAVVSTLTVYPRGKALGCLFVGGEIGRIEEWWRPMLAALEKFAHATACRRIEGALRPGWSRLLPGMKIVGAMMRKDL